MIQAICWMLIHSLWQGAIFTVGTGLAMWATRKRSSAVRYRVLSVLFFAFVGVCAGSFCREWLLAGQESGGHDTGAGSWVAGSAFSNLMDVIGAYCSDHAAPIVLGWFIVFLYKCAKTTGSLIYTQRIRHFGLREAPQEWQERVAVYCRRLGIRKPVRLLESTLVRMPLVAGHLKPMIFVPLGLLTQLPPGELEAMLLHELAHIRRHDYLINFLQHLAENIFFFNPALLWMSSLLRAEREHCCDDVAIAETDNNRVQFIQALINFKEYDLRAAGLANAFPAGKNQLMQRVMRIAQNKRDSMNAGEKMFFLGSVLAIFVLVIATGRERVDANVAVDLMKQDGLVTHWRISPPTSAPAPPVQAILRPNNRDGLVESEEVNDPVGVSYVANIEPDRQMVTSRYQTDLLRQMADEERIMADRTGQDEDRRSEEAERNEGRAGQDHVQAEKDRARGEADRERQDQEKQQAERDRQQAENERQQNEGDKWNKTVSRRKETRSRRNEIRSKLRETSNRL